MSSLLLSLTDNLAQRLHKDKCKYCKPDLEYMTAKKTAENKEIKESMFINFINLF